MQLAECTPLPVSIQTRTSSPVMHHGAVTPEIAAGLLALKKRIAAAKIPPSKIDETANIAVRNIREFGKVRRTESNGPRRGSPHS